MSRVGKLPSLERTLCWKCDSCFPSASGGWSAWRPPFGRKGEGESAVRRATWQWHPFDPLLVSVPGAERMLPPICFPIVAPALQKRMLGQYRSLLVLMVCMVLGFTVAGVILRELFFLNIGVAIFLFFVFIVLQYRLIFRKIERLPDYPRFVSWCYLQPQTQVMWITVLVLAAGAVQYYMQTQSGGLDDLVDQYGLVFNKVLAEPWRYFIGPFMHAGLSHWIANVSLLVVSSGLAFVLGRGWVIWAVFGAGVFLPGVGLTFLPHWVGLDAFLGISGGVFALFGWVVGVALKNKQLFPFGFWWVICYFIVGVAVISTLLDPRASWFAHLFGLAIGFGMGMLNSGFKTNPP